MNTSKRRIGALVAALVLFAMVAGTAQAAPLAGDSPLVVSAAERAASATKASPAPCIDRAFKLLGARWEQPYEWSYRASTTPARHGKANVANVLRRSFDNITGVRNNCGLPDRVSATHDYLGTTTRRPDCQSRDGRNVIGFGRLQYGVLAVTCYWIRNGRMVEADMKINSREVWALSLSGCRFEPSLEATITHEAGHVFGLGHVGERRHGRLTMSPFLNGPCQNNEVTLGLGDVRGLEKLY